MTSSVGCFIGASLVALGCIGAPVVACAEAPPLHVDAPPLIAAPPLATPQPVHAPDDDRRGKKPPHTDAERLASALSRFDFGDYEGVVRELELLVERGAHTTLHESDRLEALRAYGIACVMVNRRTAAEGAFLLLLEATPSARLDVRLVRPEAVAVFDEVRARNRDALFAAYRKGRGKRYAVLNLLPPAGQLQNRQYAKGYSLLGVELALLALNIASGVLLDNWRGEHQDFPGHESDAPILRGVNWVSFGAVITVVIYGIIDGFVVGHRRALEERAVERGLLGERSTPGRRFAEHLLTEGGTLGVRY